MIWGECRQQGRLVMARLFKLLRDKLRTSRIKFLKINSMFFSDTKPPRGGWSMVICVVYPTHLKHLKLTQSSGNPGGENRVGASTLACKKRIPPFQRQQDLKTYSTLPWFEIAFQKLQGKDEMQSHDSATNPTQHPQKDSVPLGRKVPEFSDFGSTASLSLSHLLRWPKKHRKLFCAWNNLSFPIPIRNFATKKVFSSPWRSCSCGGSIY